MRQIIKDVGLNKFSKEEILNTEKEVLQVLSFNLHLKTSYEESMITVKEFLF